MNTENKIWVECVENSDHIEHLTIGKLYQATEMENHYNITTDLGHHKVGYHKSRFKVIPPPVTEEKWVVAPETFGTWLTKDKKYLVYDSAENSFEVIDDGGKKNWFFKPTLISCDPPKKEGSEVKSESSGATKVSELLNQFRSLVPVLNEIGNGVKHLRITYHDCEVIFDVNDGAVVIDPFEGKQI